MQSKVQKDWTGRLPDENPGVDVESWQMTIAHVNQGQSYAHIARESKTRPGIIAQKVQSCIWRLERLQEQEEKWQALLDTGPSVLHKHEAALSQQYGISPLIEALRYTFQLCPSRFTEKERLLFETKYNFNEGRLVEPTYEEIAKTMGLADRRGVHRLWGRVLRKARLCVKQAKGGV